MEFVITFQSHVTFIKLPTKPGGWRGKGWLDKYYFVPLKITFWAEKRSICSTCAALHATSTRKTILFVCLFVFITFAIRILIFHMHNTLFSTLCNKNTNILHALYIVQHGQRVTGMAWGPNSNRLVTCGAVSTQWRRFFIVNVKCTPQYSINPFAPGDFAKKRVLKLVEWFSGHCRGIKS